MILELQKNEIREFLLDKKLSLDILLEVEDHFISQIDYFQIDENLSFENAFEKTKEIWSKDLQITKYYNGTEISVFAKKIRDREISKLFLKSIVFTLGLLFSYYLFAEITNKEIFIELSTYFIFILLGIPALHYFFNIKRFKLSLKHKPLKLNIFHGSNSLLFFCGFLLICFGTSFHKLAERIFGFVENGSSVGIASFILVGIFLWFYSFGFLLQIAFIQSLKKIQSFLNNM